MAAPWPDLKIEALASHHNREDFSCGVDSLDRYPQTQARQDVRRKANGVFILVELDKPDIVLGYYTLCATALPQGDVPTSARKHVPRYPLVAATLVGRLPGKANASAPCFWPTLYVAPMRARILSARRCSWSTLSTNGPRPSTRETALCGWRTRSASSCRCTRFCDCWSDDRRMVVLAFVVLYRHGAPRPTKMANIVSPWRYDAGA
jgi:hypothetical protein